MTDLLDGLLADLDAEGDELRALVGDLDTTGWETPTPAPGWSIAAQVAHLVWTDEAALLAARAAEPSGKPGWDALVEAALRDPTGFVDDGAARLAALPPATLLERWDGSRLALRQALRDVPAGSTMPWFGPPMSSASMATARFMETWAHTQDVRDALGIAYQASDRIRHVAHLGVRTRAFSYSVHGEQAPAQAPYVELVAPSGETWSWGTPDSAQSVRGSALDFCLLVTQRVHRDDTDLVAHSTTPGVDDAEHWLRIAQAFAGPAGEGRARR